MRDNTLLRILSSDLLDWIIRLMVIVSVVLGVSTSLSQRALSQCLYRWGNDLSASLSARQDANGRRLIALNQLAMDTAQQKPPDVLNADIDNLRKIQAEYAAVLADHPYPPPPKMAC